MSTVYILGAGSSKAENPKAPLTECLLPKAIEVLTQPSVAAVRKAYRLPKEKCTLVWDQHRAQRLREFVNRFFLYREPDTSLTDTDLPRLEDILSQLDLAIAEERPLTSDYSLQYLRHLREDIVYAIYVALEASLAEGSNLGYLDRLVRRLTSDDTIISFNYDLLVDFSLLQAKKKIDYGFSTRNPIGDPFFQGTESPALYKLHGSLNWLYCPECQQIDAATDGKSVGYIFPALDHGSPRHHPGNCGYCGVRYEPVIITPTLLKSYRNPFLGEIWRKAEERIATANEIVFFGYSMPDADMQIRCMLKRALFRSKVLREKLPMVTMVNRSPVRKGDKLGETAKRYQQFLGGLFSEAHYLNTESYFSQLAHKPLPPKLVSVPIEEI